MFPVISWVIFSLLLKVNFCSEGIIESQNVRNSKGSFLLSQLWDSFIVGYEKDGVFIGGRRQSGGGNQIAAVIVFLVLGGIIFGCIVCGYALGILLKVKWCKKVKRIREEFIQVPKTKIIDKSKFDKSRLRPEPVRKCTYTISTWSYTHEPKEGFEFNPNEENAILNTVYFPQQAYRESIMRIKSAVLFNMKEKGGTWLGCGICMLLSLGAVCSGPVAPVFGIVFCLVSMCIVDVMCVDIQPHRIVELIKAEEARYDGILKFEVKQMKQKIHEGTMITKVTRGSSTSTTKEKRYIFRTVIVVTHNPLVVGPFPAVVQQQQRVVVQQQQQMQMQGGQQQVVYAQPPGGGMPNQGGGGQQQQVVVMANNNNAQYRSNLARQQGNTFQSQ